MDNPIAGSANVEACAYTDKTLTAREPLLKLHASARFRWAAALFASLAVLAALLPSAASAQSSAVPARVTDRVNVSQTVTLQGSTHPLAQARFDQGAAPPNLPMNRIQLLLKRSPAQESALQDLLVQQQVQSSPSYHKWLTPDQFGQQFGPADADIQAVTSWLTSFGFQSIKVSRGRTVIEFSGTAAQVQTALHAPIHQYTVNGAAHWANASDPQIPAALAPVIAGFASLHNFPKKPASVRSARTAALTRTSNGKPQITFSDGSHALAPGDFNTIYNVGPSNMTGGGVTIGVIGRSNINPADVTDFRGIFGLSGSGPNIILNGPNPGDLGGGEEAEAVLDATWPGAIAPAAAIDFVISESTNAAAGEDLSEFYIIDNNLADIMTESFSVCESGFGSSLSSNANFYSTMAEQAAAQGITYVVASGDGGPDSCDDPSTLPTTPTAASVNLLAATPFTTAVGGTELHDCDPMPRCTDTGTTYWQASNGTISPSAKSYIPENVWNESCTVAQCDTATLMLSGLWSSGGGQSQFFQKPVWQSGVTGIPAGNRSVPDVSVTAADHDGYVLCLAGSCAGSSPGFQILSGTSASAQAFGGVMALVVQKMGTRQGLANYALYKLAATETYANCNGSAVPSPGSLAACVFNDITLGNTNLVVGPSDGFQASPGYDEATGLGSVNVANLVASWNTAISKGSATMLTLNGGTAVNFTHGKPVPVSITVTPSPASSPAPTGDVSLIAASATDQGVDGFTLTPGTSNSTVNSTTTLLPGGTYPVHAHYAGDGTYLGSDSAPTMVTIAPEPSRISLGLVVTTGSSCTTSTSVAYGSPYVLTVVVADVNAGSLPCSPNETGSSPTGIVSVTDAFNGGAPGQLDGGSFKLNTTGAFEDQTIQLAAGTHNIQASYPGDNSFAASATTAPTVTVTQAATTISVTSNLSTASSGQAVLLTAVVSTQSIAIANPSQEPTGTVQFFVNGTAFGNPVTVSGTVDSTGQFAQAVASDLTSALANGQDAITAKYLGDNNYTASAISASVTIGVGLPGINISSGCTGAITITAPGQSGSCSIIVGGANGFTGTAALSSTVMSTPSGAVDVPACSFGAPSLNFSPPSTISLSASSIGSATLICSSTAASRIVLRPPNGPSNIRWAMPLAAIALLCFFLVFDAGVRKLKLAPLAVSLVLSAGLVAGCGSNTTGGGGGGGTSNAGTTAGTYTFKVTATPSASAAQSITITVNVQ